MMCNIFNNNLLTFVKVNLIFAIFVHRIKKALGEKNEIPHLNLYNPKV